MPRKSPTLTVVTPRLDAITALVNQYLDHCAARGLKPKTVHEGYGYPLRGVFLPFLADEGITDPKALNARVLDRFTSRLLESGGKHGPLSKHSVHTYVRAVNHFLIWAHKEGEMAPVKAQTPRLPQRLVDVLSREEINAMEEAAMTERDKLIVRILAETGIRLSELVGLRTDDIISREQSRKEQNVTGGDGVYLRVHGKGDRDRFVPIPGLYNRLRLYVLKIRPKDATSDRLFLSSRRPGPSLSYEPLSASGVHQLIGSLGELAGIKKRVYPHLLRHSYATWALTRQVDPITLARTLGHTSLTMINKVYAHITPSDTYRALERALAIEAGKA